MEGTYVGVESPEKRCGKTTLLSVLSELVSRPVVAANISSPAFFRVIEEVRPTLVIDEANTWLQGNDVLRGISNSGYTRKTAFVVRVAQWARRRESSAELKDGKRMGLVRYSCWCPKVMAAIGRLPDTLADRCILIRMERKTVREVQSGEGAQPGTGSAVESDGGAALGGSAAGTCGYGAVAGATVASVWCEAQDAVGGKNNSEGVFIGGDDGGVSAVYTEIGAG